MLRNTKDVKHRQGGRNMKRKMTFGLKMLLTFVGIMAIFLMTGCSDKPKESADKAVLAYAELYTFASSEHLSATGMTDAQSGKISDGVLSSVKQQFASFQLTDANVDAITDAYLTDLAGRMTLETKLKKDDSEQPVVELTATPLDTAGAAQLAATDADMVSMATYMGQAAAQGVNLKADAQFQTAAMSTLKDYIHKIPLQGKKTMDVTCKLVKSDDGKDVYWAPSDPEAIARFIAGAN